MTESSLRNLKIGCGVFMLLFFGSIWTYFHFLQRAGVDAMRNAAGRGRGEVIAVTETPRAAEMRQFEYRDPERALKLADEIVKQPKNDAERRAALGRLPALLQNVAIARLRAGRRAEALAARERLEKAFPASPQVATMQKEWRQALMQVAVQTLRDGTPEAAEAAYRELWAAGPGEAERYSYQQWLDTMQRRLREAPNEPPSAERQAQQVLMASVIVEPDRTVQLAMDLANAAPDYRQLMAQADAVARSERPWAALAFWQAAIFRAERGETVNGTARPLPPKELNALKTDLRRKLGAGWTALGERLRKPEPIEFVLISPRQAYEGAAKATEGTVEEMEALVRVLEATTAEVAALAAPVTEVAFVQLNGSGQLAPELSSRIVTRSHEVRGKIVDVMRRHGTRLWQCCVETPGFDPWPSVPAPVRETIDGEKTSGQLAESERRKRLVAHYRGDFLHIPLGEADALRNILHQVLARWALVTVTSNPEDAFTMMREVLRQAVDPNLRDGLGQTLRFRIARSGKAGDFNQVYLLGGFYGGEIGMPGAGDPFRAEFRAGLEGAAENFRTRDRMKRIFILSLLAQCFPGEPAGDQARAEAFKAAFDAVASVNAERGADASLPSPLAGHSIELINNSTDHHLLFFYRSANAAISVHQWPWRRGTVIIPDGEYEYAVLSPAGSIRPFRGLAAFKGGMRRSNYVISRKGGSDDNAGQNSLASGDYKLLYAPEKLASVTIEPRSGLPRPQR